MSGPAAILQAARDGDVPAVERLLSDDPGLVRASDEHLKTPLHWAAELDRRDVAERLLDAGADLEATTSWGATALDWAATKGSTKVADLLLARGAKGMNLVAAASLGKLDLVREFLDSGAPLATLAARGYSSTGPTSMRKGSSAGPACTGRRLTVMQVQYPFSWLTVPI